MVKQVFLFLLLITILCTASAAAVPITIVGEPQTIYEFQEGYYFNTVVTYGNYVLIAERKPNDAQKTGKPVEGYRWLDSLYLYDTKRGILEEIPGKIPSEWAVLENGTVYWIDGSYGKKVTAPDGFVYLEYTTHYYQYTPGDPAHVEIAIPQNCHLTRFATDGVHLAMIRSEVLREGVLERTLTLFDLRTGRLVAQLATLDMSLVMRSTTPPTIEEPLPPQTTQAETPLGMTVGLIAFVLACVLAVLWRET